MTVRKPVARKSATKAKARAPKRELTVLEKIARLGEGVPAEELAKHPRDFARNFHHYMQGHPKTEPAASVTELR